MFTSVFDMLLDLNLLLFSARIVSKKKDHTFFNLVFLWLSTSWSQMNKMDDESRCPTSLQIFDVDQKEK